MINIESEIIAKTPNRIYKLKEEIKKIKQRDKELNFRAGKTEEHLDHLDIPKDIGSLFEKISKLNIPRLKEQHIHKIMDIMPATIKDLNVVMQGYTISVNNENMKKIVDAVTKSIEKK